MSEEIKQEVAESGEGQGHVDVNELVAEINKLRSTNERLLNESKQFKTKRSELEELQNKIQSYEQKKLEEEGNWQEMLKREREEKSNLELKLKKQSNDILKANIYNSVANVAKDAFDVGDLLAQSEYASVIEVDEDNLAPDVSTIEKFVSSLRENKPYLFKGRKVAAMADGKPSINKPMAKSFNEMSQKEREAAMIDALSKI